MKILIKHNNRLNKLKKFKVNYSKLQNLLTNYLKELKQLLTRIFKLSQEIILQEEVAFKNNQNKAHQKKPVVKGPEEEAFKQIKKC